MDLIGEVRAAERRKVVRRRIAVVVLLIVIALLGVVAKLLWDERRLQQGIASAHEQFSAGDPASLAEAARTLRGNLQLREADGDTQAALALVLAQTALETGGDPADARNAVAAAGGGSAEAEVARGILALLDGDHEAALAACGRADRLADDGGFAPRHASWLRAFVALAVGDAEPMGAMAGLEPALETTDAWPAYHRTAIELDFAGARIDAAMQRMETARAQLSSDVGLAVDEALYLALLRRKVGGIGDAVDVLTQSGLGPRDRARALIARAAASYALGKRDLAGADVEDAKAIAPAWDRGTRLLAIEVLLGAGEAAAARQWIEDTELPEARTDVLAAWATLAEGNAAAALGRLEKLPQDDGRVAYLQALALTEQGRFDEAGPWIDRAKRMNPGRIELDVALARTQAHTADAAAAAKQLEQIANDDAYAPRVWTAHGEALLRADAKANAEAAKKSFEQAVEREHLPAEALLRLGRLARFEARSDPEAFARAREHFERAAETNPHRSEPRAELGTLLADMGFAAQAEETLRAVAEEGAGPDALLRLAVVAAERPVIKGRKQRKKEIADWLDAAASAGADPNTVERARARIALADGSPEAVTIARQILDRLGPTDPKDVNLQVLHARAYVAYGDQAAARQILRTVQRKIRFQYRGRYHLMFARIEREFGSKRRAAALSWKAFTAMAKEGRSPAELLDAAAFGIKAWRAIKQKSGARGIARELTERVPFHPRAWLLRANVQLEDDKLDWACQSAKKAIALDPDLAEAHAAHGECLRRSGDRENAKKAYETAAKHAKGTPKAKQYRKMLRRL